LASFVFSATGFTVTLATVITVPGLIQLLAAV
jgi:hypothetical protein